MIGFDISELQEKVHVSATKLVWKQDEPCPETPDAYFFYETLEHLQMTPQAKKGLVKVECCKFLNTKMQYCNWIN